MSDTPPDLAALFELERATRVEPPPDVRARVLAAVLSRAGGPGGGGPTSGGSGPAAPVAPTALGPIAAASAISIVLGIGIGFLARGALQPDPIIPAVEVVEVVMEVTETATPTVEDPPPTSMDGGRADTGPSIPPPRSRPEHRAPRLIGPPVDLPDLPSAPSPGPTTAQERATIDHARVALRGDHFHEALVALMGHERRFAGGQFAEERERLIVEALVGARRWVAARRRVEQYRLVYPQGLHRQAVNTLAERIPRTP